jgi:chorismate mutase-like protein
MRHQVEKHLKLLKDALLRQSIRRTMQIIEGALAILITLAIAGIGSAFAQDATNKLQSLVETSARRLVLAKQVALAKWDSQAPVEDTAREAEVITAAIKDGESRGLDRTSVSRFFQRKSRLINSFNMCYWQTGVARAPCQPTGRSI